VSESPAVFEFGPFRFDGAKGVLWRGGEIVRVSPKALDLLAVLLEPPRDLVTKEELLRRVWPDAFVEEANLSVNVSILRKTLGRRLDGRPWIETVPRRGYRFAGEVKAAAAAPHVLAVLPFRPLQPSEENELLGLGMADALITRLAATGRVVVRPTSAIRPYVGAEPDPREVGRSLRVDAVLDGRLQRDGTRLRVTAQLLPTSGTAPLWADSFDAGLADLFAVQDRVAERLASALALEMTADERRRLSRHHTESLEAYRAYTRGRHFWTRFAPAWMGKAVDCFQDAAALDPAYALPHAGLADAFLVAGFSGLMPPREAWAEAARAAAHARELDDQLSEAHISSAYLRLFQDWDWRGAERHLLRALELHPHSPAAHQWHGLYLDLRGRLGEASAAIARAVDLDPLSLVASALTGLQHFLEGDYARQLQQARRTVELDPHQFVGHWALGIALAAAGDPEGAVAAHRRALELVEGAAVMKPVLARSLALAERHEDARALLLELEGDEAGFVSPYQRATVHVALGEKKLALALLRRGCDERDPWAVWLRVDPMLAPLRGDATFQSMVAEVSAGVG
jgi:DNA-binding winged helix-turn-helix (wHTH) protein/Flp pilus assembly protein TadD